MGKLPLEGIRVCDFGWVVVGPVVSQMLAVMGAEVIKIESSVHTDINRRIGPFLDGVEGIERSGNFHRVNLSKRSCSLDLTKPKGMELAKEIVRISDIVLSNFRYGVMERFGLGYDILKELKSDLILVSSSGMGNSGSSRDFVCYNEEAYAYAGLGYLTGYEDKEPGLIVGDFGDYLTGTLETMAILSALHYRSRTGKGQVIEVSMTEAIATQVPEAIMDYSMNQRVRGRIGNHMEFMAPHNCYPCQGKDKWIAIAVANDEEWRNFCKAVGRQEWAEDNRFNDQFSRWQNQAELDRLIMGWTRNHSANEVMEILQSAGVAAGPSLSIEQVVNDPHLNQRGFFVAPDHPEVGQRVLEGMPWKSNIYEPVFKPAPLLGQDNFYVFHDLLGMSDEDVARLVGEEIIV
jgi:benzylsuccinate CoA-transferase BbsF subunit